MSFNNVQELGRPITIKDEGVTLTANVGSIDMVGSGVTATSIGAAVTTTIPGSSGGSSLLAATGTVDGVNKIFTFTSAPSIITVDQGRPMQKTSSDGTVNWTGTTTVTLAVAPTSDVFGQG